MQRPTLIIIFYQAVPRIAVLHDRINCDRPFKERDEQILMRQYSAKKLLFAFYLSNSRKIDSDANHTTIFHCSKLRNFQVATFDK